MSALEHPPPTAPHNVGPTCLTMMMMTMTMTMTTMMMMAPHGAPQPHMPDDDQGSTVQTPPLIMPLPILYNFHLFSTRPPIILAGIRLGKITPI